MNSASVKNRRTAQSCSAFLTRIDAVPAAELGNQTGSILDPEMILQTPAFLRVLAGQNRSRQKRVAAKQALRFSQDFPKTFSKFCDYFVTLFSAGKSLEY